MNHGGIVLMLEQTQEDKRKPFELTSNSKLLARAPWLKDVDSAAVNTFVERCVQKDFTPPRTLFEFGEWADTMYMVDAGLIRVTNKETGLSFYCGSGGSLLGVALLNGRHREEAEVVSTSSLWAIGDWIVGAMEEHPSLRKALREQSQLQSSKMNAHFGRLFRADRRQRLLLTLIQIGEQIAPQQYPFTIDFWRSHDHIGGIIDACRLTISQSLRFLEKEGAIRYVPREGSMSLQIILESEECISRIEYLLKTVLS
jgi:CRP-like cAMP-binding protein